MYTIKIIFYSIFLLIIVGYMLGVEVNFKPFYIKFTSLSYGIGIILIIIGVFFISYNKYKQGYQDSLKDTTKALKEKAEELKRERKW